jgi:hypothetical protein
MRRAASASVAAVALAAVAGCGGSAPNGQRSLDAFLSGTQGRSWAKRFPHRPGSLPCTALDRTLQQRVAATCSTDVALRDTGVIVTFTQSWSHGNRARTWFVFLHRDGTVESVTREGTPG